MGSFDVLVFNFINHGLSNPFCDFIMPLISRLGGGILYFLLGVFFLFSKKKETKLLGVFLIAGLTISYYSVGFMKILFSRPRPFIALPSAILLGAVEKGFSFPSNHAVISFMAAFLLASRFKMYIMLYLFASLVAFSRVYVGVHYPSDVISGAMIGCLIGWGLLLIWRKIEANTPSA